MKSKRMLRAIVLLILLISFLPVDAANALPANATTPPPADMFQLPWDYGSAWMAIDGIDNGFKRPLSSSHNYSVGGAIDFAPHKYTYKGEDTSNFWVAAAASGTVVAVSSCYIILDHHNGWVSQYQFLGNVQVHLGDAVNRNQRLGIIADGVRYKFCLGSTEPDIPHLHFMLRPTLIGASLAGWQVNYNSLFSITTFKKNNTSLGLYQLLLNTFDQTSSTPTPTPSLTQPPSTEVTSTPSATATPPTGTTPTPTGSYGSTTVDSPNIDIGETTLVTVSLNNVPPEGYTSAEITCTYNPAILQTSNIVIKDLFGPDPAVAINDPQNGSFIVAIAGSHGNKATTSGPVFTFNVKGLQAGQVNIECKVRVSSGNSQLVDIPSIGTVITVGAILPTPTITPSLPPMTPTISPTTCNQAESTGYVAIPLGTAIASGTTFTQSWGLRNIGWCTWTPDYRLVFYSGEQMGAPLSINIPYNVEPGQLIILSVNFTAPAINGHYISLWKLRDPLGAQFGVGASANDPLALDIVVSDPTATPFPTPTSPTDNWLTFLNQTYAFQFKYPSQATIGDGGNDNDTFIYLPIVPGTNLGTKYLEMVVAENANPCQSPLATQSMLETSETVTINGLSFLKQTGQDATAGHTNKWTAYSTLRNNVCVSLDFILRAANPGVFATPPPLYDDATESAVFGQMVSTFAWLSQVPTSSPTPPQNGTLTGQVFSTKPVTVELFGLEDSLLGSATIDPNKTFALTAPGGTYKVVVSSSGFLSAEASVTITNGTTTTLSSITLPAGDIDGNNVIDQFDALTIGMNYNASQPSVADLNNDGIINVLDLEALARNYRKTGPIPWQ